MKMNFFIFSDQIKTTGDSSTSAADRDSLGNLEMAQSTIQNWTIRWLVGTQSTHWGHSSTSSKHKYRYASFKLK